MFRGQKSPQLRAVTVWQPVSENFLYGPSVGPAGTVAHSHERQPVVNMPIFLSHEMATATIPDVHPQTSTSIRIQFRVDQGNRGTLPETIFADDVLPDFECISGPIPFAYN